MGLPHHSGRAAQRMLENEGFTHNKYIDIFDGGPTMTVDTDQIATVRDAREHPILAITDDRPESAVESIVTHGRLAQFRACYGLVDLQGDGVAIDARAAKTLGVGVGDTITHVKR